ncbi:MAG: CDGSH-type Zn-finger protein [Nitriliruptoraceae bacterium]|jgi:CDGSH-type Zn-finger protein
MADINITASKNGPLLVQGPVSIKATDGTVIKESAGNVALCRCGASANKPFCDGGHTSDGFESTVTAD